MKFRSIIPRPVRVKRAAFKFGFSYRPVSTNQNWTDSDYYIFLFPEDNKEFGLQKGDLMCLAGGVLHRGNHWGFGDDVFREEVAKKEYVAKAFAGLQVLVSKGKSLKISI